MKPGTLNPLTWWGLSIFWIGFAFKVMHWPLASLGIIVGTLLLVIAVPLRPRRDGVVDWLGVCLRGTLATAHLFLLVRIQFWYGAPQLLLLHMAMTGILLVVYFRSNFRPLRAAFIVPVFALLSLGIYFVPAYTISYHLGVGSPLHRDLAPYSYHGWQNYSWFLHLAGEESRSLAAMDSALMAAQRCVSENGHDPAIVHFYQTERARLLAGMWDSYLPPPDEYNNSRGPNVIDSTNIGTTAGR